MSEEQGRAVTTTGATESQPIAELEQAVQTDPTSGAAWASLGRAYREADAHELARAAFEQAVRFCSGSPMHWFGLGIAALDTGDPEGALAAALRAVELAPDVSGLRVLLARAFGRLGVARQAILHLEEALRLDPQSPIPLADLGWAHLAIGDHDAAAEAFEAALRLDPDQPALWSVLGRCLLEQGHPSNAVHVLETAVFARPADGLAWARLGRSYFETDRHAEAARAFTRAFEHGEDEPWAWYWAGRNAAALGDGEALDRARRELKERDAELLRELETRVEAIAAQATTATPEEGPCHSPSAPTAA